MFNKKFWIRVLISVIVGLVVKTVLECLFKDENTDKEEDSEVYSV